MTRRLVALGMGPGDPDLVTVRSVRVLQQADVVLVPATEGSGDGPGRAERIVATVCPDASARIRRIPFSMADRSGVSSRRKQAWMTSATAALDAFESGAEVVAFATVGDPSVYSTFSYLSAHVTSRMPEVEVEVVPGITAMQALAAASRTPLVEGTEVLALVPVTAGMDTVQKVLDVADTVVAYKGGRRLPQVLGMVRDQGRDAVLGVELGTGDEQLLRLDEIDDDQTAPYFSTVLVPARRDSTGGRL